MATDIEFQGSVASTNDIATDKARGGAPHGWAVVASEQTEGRGRRGNAWSSQAGGLYLSVVLRPSVPMGFFVALPAVVSMGVFDALRALGLGGRVGIKWPNDVVASAGEGAPFDRKLAGILVEARSSAEGAFAVAGIGLNVAPVAENNLHTAVSAGRSAAVPPLAPISLGELLPSQREPNRELACAIRDAVVARVDAWAAAISARPAAGPLAPVLSEYFDMLPMMGRDVAVVAPEGHVVDTGILSGVDAWGRAIVRTPSGEEKALVAEAASLREVL